MNAKPYKTVFDASKATKSQVQPADEVFMHTSNVGAYATAVKEFTVHFQNGTSVTYTIKTPGEIYKPEDGTTITYSR